MVERPTRVWTHSSFLLLSPWQPPSVCLLRSDMREKVFLQPGHEYFLVCRCVCRCARRFDLSAKEREQYVHANGFSPVCVLQEHCHVDYVDNGLTNK